MRIYAAILSISLFTLSCTSEVKEYKNLKTKDYTAGFRAEAQPVYSGDSLRNILFPVGGIGTGDLLIGGRGEIREMEIFGKPDLDELPPYMTFFALWMKEESAFNTVEEVEFEPVVKILEGRISDDHPNPFGIPRQQLSGLPRFDRAVFRGEYPLAWIDLKDKDVPLDISMEVCNPFIPLDPDNSSLPAAIFHWMIRNKLEKPVSISLLLSISNPFQKTMADGQRTFRGGSAYYDEIGEYVAITLRSPETDWQSADYGNMTVVTLPGASIQTHGYSGGWWDDAHVFLEDFSKDGQLEQVEDESVNSSGNPDVSCLWITRKLEPGEKVVIPFIITWYVPVRITENSMAFGNKEALNQKVINYYSTLFKSSGEVADHIISNREYLFNSTMAYHDALFGSSYPAYIIDAIGSNTASLKTNLLMQDQLGRVHGFEGLGNDFGCCPGNCTHVWNYAQAMAFLFPSLERKIREVSFLHDTYENGYQCFRTTFPPGDYWFKNVAADGQMGNIVRVYREWKLSGDSLWLSGLWPKVQAALEFAWKGSGNPAKGYEWQSNARIPWDPDKEGVMRGDQHNTYDINFYGPNTMTGSLYLGALKACSEMAEYFGDTLKSKEYFDLYLNGRAGYEKLCWNGEYFNQRVEVIEGIELPGRLGKAAFEQGKTIPKYQYGDGCLSDQLFGQFLAHVSGLGYLLDSGKVNQAMRSIYRYNFVKDFSGFNNVQRVYAVNHEGGLVACTWPHGGRPEFPFVYADETWTGIEYQAASGMIWSGYVEEGLQVVQAVRDRYRGYNRNPWAEIESGRFYARSMSSWGILLALSGFEYDGVNHIIGFNPKVNRNEFNTFWSCGSGWGEFRINDSRMELTVLHGTLNLKELHLPADYGFVSVVTLNNGTADLTKSENKLNIQFKTSLLLAKGDTLDMNFGK